jgi:hypothetical protein
MSREFVRRATWTFHQLSAAIGAGAPENGGGTVKAERAFKRTDERIVSLGRKVAVTAFAVRAELKHLFTPSHTISAVIASRRIAGHLREDDPVTIRISEAKLLVVH